MLNNINTPSLALLGCKAGCNSYKTLIFNVYCGEGGTNNLYIIEYHTMPKSLSLK